MSGKRVGIRDVAKEAGVSITTVSRALNGYEDVNAETKKRILDVVERLNYAPDANARSLGGISKTTIALLLSGLYKKDDSGFVFGLISGMHKVASENNCEFIILTTDIQAQTKTSYLRMCRQKNVNGLLISGLDMNDPYYHELMNSEIPCVVVEGEFSSNNVCGISIDNEMAAYEVVRYLIELGHKRIAMMNGKSSADVSVRRQKGYCQALRNSGIEVDESLICDGNYLEESAYAQTGILIEQHPDVTAIFCASDVMAIGVINALNKLGRNVPEDISIVGFDDIPMAAYVTGGLTTVKQSFYDMGITGAKALYEMITKGRTYKHIYEPYGFIKRSTTAPPKRA